MAVIRPRDPEAEYLIVKVVGGEQPGATFSQKVGPMKIPGTEVGEEIKKLIATDFRCQKVHVEIKVKDRKATAEIIPSTPQIIIRELKENREPKKKGGDKKLTLHNGSLSLDSLFKIVAEVRGRSRSKSLRGTLKEVLGTCLAVGCFIEGKHPKEVTSAVNGGRTVFAELFNMTDDIDSLLAFLDE